jgi:ABC-type lipoprotein release transport system permease subunit
MRDKDQEYWEQYRGTPKAFVNLKVGQEMWGNRWGNVTSLRWPAGTDRAEIETALREKLTPEQLGFQFIPLREQALAATKAPVDFGELFVSFSFFLIIAAAALTGLLFVFSLEQRNAEAGLLLALGLRPRLVRRMFLLEGAALALIGSVLGAVGAVLYTKLVLRALATVWRGAVGAVEFTFAPEPMTLAIGVVAGVCIALLAMWLASRKQMRHSARELLAGELEGSSSGRGPGGERRWLIVGSVCALLAIALALFGGKSPALFFGAGALLLLAGIFLALAALRSVGRGDGLRDLAQLGLRNAARRRGRSLATIGVLASGVFMVVAVDSFRKAPPADGDTSDPGTGGFALVGESALPIYEDLNSAKGREAYGLSDEAMRDVKVVPLRVRDGDDASCLNLNRALQPRILGVKPAELSDRKAFRISPAGYDWGWLTLNASAEEIPGIVDANTLQWAMQKKLGDAIEYRDDRGQTLRVRIVATVVGSMLQGNVLIAEDEFVKRFPNSGGYRYFLIDCPREKTGAVQAELSRALSDRGLELTTTARRLAEFQAVENTYLAIFQVLGGLGLLLGSAGLAIVVARNVLERRREFGLLEAVGFRPRQLRKLVFAEHRWLILCGLVIGTVSALVAVWPNLRERASGFPYLEMTLLLAGLLIGCIFWAWLATRLALRGSGVAALRSE